MSDHATRINTTLESQADSSLAANVRTARARLEDVNAGLGKTPEFPPLRIATVDPGYAAKDTVLLVTDVLFSRLAWPDPGKRFASWGDQYDAVGTAGILVTPEKTSLVEVVTGIVDKKPLVTPNPFREATSINWYSLDDPFDQLAALAKWSGRAHASFPAYDVPGLRSRFLDQPPPPPPPPTAMGRMTAILQRVPKAVARLRA